MMFYVSAILSFTYSQNLQPHTQGVIWNLFSSATPYKLFLFTAKSFLKMHFIPLFCHSHTRKMKQNSTVSTLKRKKSKPKAVYIVNILKDLKKAVSETWCKQVQWFPVCNKENTFSLIPDATPRQDSSLQMQQA